MNIYLPNCSPRFFVGVLSIVVCMSFCSEMAWAQQRTWLDDTGVHEFQAEFVDVVNQDGKTFVVLKPPTGAEIQVPLDRFSAKDQEYVASIVNPEPDLDPSPEEPVPADPVPADPVPAGTAPTGEGNPEAPAMTAGTGGVPSEGTGVANSGLSNSELSNSELSNGLAKSGVGGNSNGTMNGNQPGNPPNGRSVALPLEKTRPGERVKVDPVLLDDLDRNAEGLAKKNPVYLVPVDTSQFSLLNGSLQQIVRTLHESDSVVEKEKALEALTTGWPQVREPVLVSVVINAASAREKSIRKLAIELLANRDSDQSLRYILARVDDTSFEVRWRAYELLEELGDPRMVSELAKRFPGRDRKKISNVLKVVGSQAESAVLPYLDHRDRDTVLDTCNLLATIGTELSLTKLDEVSTKAKTMMVKVQARTTGEQIRERMAARANPNSNTKPNSNSNGSLRGNFNSSNN